MSRLTPEMEKKILDLYEKRPSYKWVADKVDMDWRTVKRVVERAKKASEEMTSAPKRPDGSPTAAAADSQKDTSSPAEQVNTHQASGPVTDKGGDGTIAIGMANDHSGERLPADQNHKEIVENSGRKKVAIPEPNEVFKLMYSAFAQGKGPEEVVSLYALDPDFVNEHYQKFLKMRRCNPLLLQYMILDALDTSSSSSLQKYARKMDEQGYLTNNDVIDLIRTALAEYEKEAVARLLNDPKVSPPAGWRKLSCKRCGRSYSFTEHYSEDGKRLDTATIRRDGLCYGFIPEVPRRGQLRWF